MRISPTKLLHGLLYTAPVILLTLVACGGGGSTPPASPFLGGYTVGGDFTPPPGSGLVLRLNGGNDLVVTSGVANYVFTTRIINGSSYMVTVLTHPSAPVQVCTLASAASGIMPSTNVTNANVTCVPAYTIGGTIVSVASGVASGVAAASGIGPILLNNNGDSLFIDYITPTAASFVFSVPVASGVTYAVTQLARARSPTQTCTISPASGVASASSVNEVMIQCQVVTAVPKFAYVTNSASNTVSAYTIGAASGVLTYQGTAQTGSKPYSVTVEPGGRFAYVANLDSHTISAYSIDASSGVLTAIDANGIVAGTTIATGTGPISVTVHPSGKFAYVVNGVAGSALSGDSISAYSINVTTGALSAIDADGAPGTQATIATGSEPKAIAIDPTGQFAYVANYGSGTASHTVSAYTLDQTTGALTNVGSYTPGTGPTSIAIDPTGKFAYVANSTSDDVSAYTISASGVLTAAASGAIAAETAPRSVAVADTGSGMYAYVANAGSGTVSAYTINTSTGVLTALTAGASAVAGATPVSVNVDPSGQFVYVANFDSNNVSVYSIGASGVLTAAASAVATEGRPTSVTTTQ